MLSQSIRVTRSSIARIARPQLFSKRTLITPTAVRQADLVQDLYLREIKAYKPVPVKASDSEGHVQKFSAPATPKSPEETDIANELKAYEASSVDLVGSEGSEEGAAPIDQDWFEEEEEDDDHHAKGH